jgi:hypothetical protein
MADFVIANYEMDVAGSRPIKVLSDTITTVNPNHNVDGTGSYVRARGSRKKYGTLARSITIARPIGTDAPYNSGSKTVRIPILTKAAYNGINVGAAYTYKALENWTVVGKNPESTR